MEKKKKGLLIAFIIIGVFLLLFLGLRSYKEYRINKKIQEFESDNYYLDPQLGGAEIMETEAIDWQEAATADGSSQNCQPDVQLYIKDISLNPAATKEKLKPVVSLNLSPAEPPLSVVPFENQEDPPSEGIKVLTPEEGAVLMVGADFELTWEIDSGRNLSVDVLISSDAGQNYTELARGIENQNSYTVTLPDTPSDSCKFRINVWTGTAYLGYNESKLFTIEAPVTEAPAPEAPESQTEAAEEEETQSLPAVNQAVNPYEYTLNDGALIMSSGNTLRTFWLQHAFSNVDHIVWQLSTVKFPCDQSLPAGELSGLIAYGNLSGDTAVFDLDFSAILDAYDVAQNETGTEENKGAAFETNADLVLLDQSRRTLYLRALLYDDKEQVIGVTGSGFQLIYGEPALDLAVSEESGYDAPILSAKTEPGFAPGSFEEIPDNGLYLFNNGNFDRTIMLSEIPTESVEIDLQIATRPFENATLSDYQQPDGLIYRDQKTGLTYTTTTHYYNLSFSGFAPELLSLGSETSRYYIRAVCYVPGEAAGSVVPVATKSTAIVFTGDLKIYFAGNFDPSEQPPEEVEVKSYVPHTEFQRYIPVSWALKNANEYFEVTRPIQAEEICFYIKNSKTGDFLYPYELHMFLYPGTTRAEYQEIVDRMLPPGAWFHLTMKEASGWDAIWAEFTDLLTQIYNEIQANYNGLKATVANTVADRFAFLGEDVQSAIRTSVTALMDYGLASVGIPPTLPNFEALADQGLDYCVRVAIEETAKSMDIPVDQIPADVRAAISQEVSQQLNGLAELKNVNPFNVGYLKPATEAQYRPAYLDVTLFNQHDQRSPAGTLTIAYYPPGKPHFKIYDYVSLPIPTLGPGESTNIRVYLNPDNTELPVYQEYYWGDTGECELIIRAEYDVKSLEEAAAEQGASGESDWLPDTYVYDVDPVYEYRALNTPSEKLFN